jgi:lipopolysaccharide/colanic/teichoic acid biosynthesis glycosyltransferase
VSYRALDARVSPPPDGAAAVPADVTAAFAECAHRFGQRMSDRRSGYYATKRAIDLVVALTLLVVLLPLLAVIAVAIKLDSPGPVLFVQYRVGSRRSVRNGRSIWTLCLFPFYKFRSMAADADPRRHEDHIRAYVIGTANANGAQRSFKLTDDPRVTRVGRLLRISSLDELPQLLNVALSHMTLVGPRPLPVYEVMLYEDAQFARFAARQGITGLWQVSGRASVPFEEMTALDTTYAQSQSLGRDLKILARTPMAVISRRGAG